MVQARHYLDSNPLFNAPSRLTLCPLHLIVNEHIYMRCYVVIATSYGNIVHYYGNVAHHYNTVASVGTNPSMSYCTVGLEMTCGARTTQYQWLLCSYLVLDKVLLKY